MLLLGHSISPQFRFLLFIITDFYKKRMIYRGDYMYKKLKYGKDSFLIGFFSELTKILLGL